MLISTIKDLVLPMRYCLRLLGLFLLLSVTAKAQEEPYANLGQAYGFDAGQDAFIFADTANVRTAPDAGAPIRDRLPQGTTVHIEKIGDVYELNGKQVPWCTVSYKVNGVVRNGQLWSGLLSPRMLRRGDVQFLYGMRFAASDTEETIVDLKALRHDSVIARTFFTMASLEAAQRAHEAKIHTNKGLTGLHCLLYFYYSGEACAVPTYEQYIGWNGTRFVKLPLLTSSADAGVYAETETFVFPEDKGGIVGMLLYRKRLQAYDENDKPVKKTNKTTRYQWDAATQRLVRQ